MKYVARIAVEFLQKVARDWDEMSYEEQKEYLKEHRKSKRRMTAKPEVKMELPKGYTVGRESMFGSGLQTNVIRKDGGDSNTFVMFNKDSDGKIDVTYTKGNKDVKNEYGLKDMHNVISRAVDFLYDAQDKDNLLNSKDIENEKVVNDCIDDVKKAGFDVDIDNGVIVVVGKKKTFKVTRLYEGGSGAMNYGKHDDVKYEAFFSDAEDMMNTMSTEEHSLVR